MVLLKAPVRTGEPELGFWPEQPATLTPQEFTAGQCSCTQMGEKAEPEFRAVMMFSADRK